MQTSVKMKIVTMTVNIQKCCWALQELASSVGAPTELELPQASTVANYSPQEKNCPRKRPWRPLCKIASFNSFASLPAALIFKAGRAFIHSSRPNLTRFRLICQPKNGLKLEQRGDAGGFNCCQLPAPGGLFAKSTLIALPARGLDFFMGRGLLCTEVGAWGAIMLWSSPNLTLPPNLTL